MKPAPPTIWEDCYDAQWGDLLTSEAFAHPAKYARGLIERIFDHMLERGWIKTGQIVGDPFGGVGTGGIVAAYRDLVYVGVELEPRFCKLALENFALHNRRFELLGVPRPAMISGDSRNFHRLVSAHIAAIACSPPYANSLRTGDQEGIDWTKAEEAGRDRGKHEKGSSATGDYGQTPGQIGKLSGGSLDSVIGSPPYVGGGHHPDQTGAWNKNGRGQEGRREPYGATAGQIGQLQPGSIDAAITSPPYADIAAGAGGLNTKPASKPGQQSGRSPTSASQSGNWSKDLLRYGKEPGQISQLKSGDVNGVITSPPWMNNCEGGIKKSKLKKAPSSGKGHHCSPEARARQLERDDQREYGTTAGQIGQKKAESYWEACHQVYQSCFLALKPGGYIAVVVKDFVKDKKRVALSDQTGRLLEHVGFILVERVHAQLVKETRHADLFEGETVKTKSRKSFFRRLAESKGSPPIDHEDVLFYQKPLL